MHVHIQNSNSKGEVHQKRVDGQSHEVNKTERSPNRDFFMNSSDKLYCAHAGSCTK